MPRYRHFCHYCDAFLTHDSPAVRKTHNNGRKHKENVRLYYQRWYDENIKDQVAQAGNNISNFPSYQSFNAPPTNSAAIPGLGRGYMPMLRPPTCMPPLPQGMRPPMMHGNVGVAPVFNPSPVPPSNPQLQNPKH